MRDVSARGTRIRFADLGAGPPLVLVHDYLSSRVAWDDVSLRLATHFRLIVPDLPGFGESEKPPPARYAYTFEAFAESLVDLVAALDLGRVSICGHSMGAGVALTIAASHPDVVDRLILLAPLVYPEGMDAVSRVATVPVVGAVLFKQLYGKRLFRRTFRQRMYGASSSVPTERIDQLFELFNAPAAREAAHATMLSMQDTRPLIAMVPRVGVPTLVAWGRDDRAAPAMHGRRLARELRSARLEMFDCGHSPAEECPDAFADAAIAFLKEPGGPVLGHAHHPPKAP